MVVAMVEAVVVEAMVTVVEAVVTVMVLTVMAMVMAVVTGEVVDGMVLVGAIGDHIIMDLDGVDPQDTGHKLQMDIQFGYLDSG